MKPGNPILQFGTGRFLQAHVGLFVSEALARGDALGGITVVQTTGSPASTARTAAMAAGEGYEVRIRGLVDGRVQDVFNNLAFILAALLLMAPFGFIPFSNTLPGLALLLYAIGMIQRDGMAILLGHLANIGTIIYFGILIGGGGMAAHGLLRHFTG